MIYIYDILLNFNNDLYEFYEWDRKDHIIHVKRIGMYKVSTQLLNDVITKKIKFNENFLIDILNKCEVYENRKIKTINYACLLTDSYQTIGILLDDLGNIIKISDLLLDECFETLEISARCKIKDFEYNILGNKKNYPFQTRTESKIKKYLLKEINTAYKDKEYYKLKYLYFEYFNKNIDNIEQIYQDLINSFRLIINKKHFHLYELIKLSNQKEVKYRI